MLERSIADEVEAAIKAGSTEKHLDTLKQVTDLFLLSADGYTGEQIELFGDVLERLIRPSSCARWPMSPRASRSPK